MKASLNLNLLKYLKFTKEKYKFVFSVLHDAYDKKYIYLAVNLYNCVSSASNVTRCRMGQVQLKMGFYFCGVAVIFHFVHLQMADIRLGKRVFNNY